MERFPALNTLIIGYDYTIVSCQPKLYIDITYSVVCWWRPRETKEGASAFSIQPNCWRPTVLIWSELNWECESCWYLDDHHIVQHPAKPSCGGTLESLTLEAEQQPAGRYWLGTSSNVTTPAPAARSSPAPAQPPAPVTGCGRTLQGWQTRAFQMIYTSSEGFMDYQQSTLRSVWWHFGEGVGSCNTILLLTTQATLGHESRRQCACAAQLLCAAVPYVLCRAALPAAWLL